MMPNIRTSFPTLPSKSFRLCFSSCEKQEDKEKATWKVRTDGFTMNLVRFESHPLHKPPKGALNQLWPPQFFFVIKTAFVLTLK